MLAMIANHLWQSTLFAVGIALLTLAFRNDGAHVRFWLWWAASIKFLVPFSLLTSIGRWAAPGESIVNVPEAWSIAARRVAEPVADGFSALLGPALVVAWSAGLVAVLAYGLARLGHVRGLRRRAEPAPAPLFDGRRAIEVRYSAELVEPSMIGIFTPALVMPSDIASRLTATQLEAVVAHELCHARRRDNLTAAVHMLVEAVFWFHPLVWWIGARLVDERERACDEAVVRSGHDRAAYAEGILDVCARYAGSRLACAAGVSGADLKRRITQIMRGDVMSKLGFEKKILLGAVATGVLGVPVLVGLLSHGTVLAQEARQAEPWLPIVKVAPVYPERALERGLDGYVVVEYTVTEQGAVENVAVVESSSNLFHESAVESIRKYKYRPRVENGQPVAVPGVQSVIRFELGEDV